MHQAVQPPRTGGATAWAAGLGGATAPARRCNRPGHVFQRDWAVQPPQPRGATAQGSVSKRDWAVQPPLSRGSTARAQVPSSAKRCNHRARSSSSGREVQPPQSRGGTAWGSVSEPDSGGATAPDTEVQPPGLSPRALPGGATAPIRRCNRLIPEFRDLIVLTSKFELGWGL